MVDGGSEREDVRGAEAAGGGNTGLWSRPPRLLPGHGVVRPRRLGGCPAPRGAFAEGRRADRPRRPASPCGEGAARSHAAMPGRRHEAEGAASRRWHHRRRPAPFRPSDHDTGQSRGGRLAAGFFFASPPPPLNPSSVHSRHGRDGRGTREAAEDTPRSILLTTRSVQGWPKHQNNTEPILLLIQASSRRAKFFSFDEQSFIALTSEKISPKKLVVVFSRFFRAATAKFT